MIARLNAYEPMDFPVPTPGFLGDDSVPPDITDTISMVDPSIFSDPQPVAPTFDWSMPAPIVPVFDPTVMAPPVIPQTLPASPALQQQVAPAPQTSWLDSVFNIFKPATALAASAATSIPSGSISTMVQPAKPQVPPSGFVASAENLITGSTMIAGVPNLFVIGASYLAIKFFSGRNVEFSYSRRSPRKSKA